MKKRIPITKFFPIYAAVLVGCLCIAHFGSGAVTVMVENAPITDRTCIVIDPGHGGIDGGATSCSGVLESQFNLEIALRLEDIFHLLGYDTKLIRREDVSVYTTGQTIAQKKVSDLKNRVKLINETKNGILLSIHQNYYPDSRYSGVQVFCGNSEGSEALAKHLQASLVAGLNPGSRRQAKQGKGIYLLEHIQCPGALIECGFLSNPREEALLRDSAYQKKLCCVIGSALNRYLSQ